MITPRVALIQSCLNLLQSLLERSELSEDSADMELELDRLFAFALAWTVGGVLDLEDRVKLHYYLIEKAPATTSTTRTRVRFE
jgi:dynein heavy chain